jgi:hypothetical protein
MALLALLAIAVMSFAYVLTSRLNAASQFVAVDRDHNARVMSQAKQALVGWMAMNAAGTNDEPGRLPCPEAPGYFGDPAQEGIAAGSCAPPNNVGRLPWRTLGMERPVDAAGEPLWYAVSPGWSLPGASTTVINSDTAGQLAFNGVGNDAVALVIAPGAAIAVQAGGGCAARSQARPAAGPPNVRDYLECGNEAGAFVASAAGQSFNDQVLRVATADLIPALEAAIQERMQREIAPALRGIYASAPWKWSATDFLTTANPLYPFAVPFGNPGLSSYRGAKMVDRWQGLLPVVYSETSPGSGVPCTGDPRCDPLFVRWTGGTLSGPSIYSASCNVVTSATTRLDCTFYYRCLLLLCTPPTLSYTIQAQASNVGMALRQINLAAPIGSANVTANIASAEGVFNSAGGVALTLSGTATPDGSGAFLSALLGNTFCGLPIIGPVLGCKPSLISVPIGVIADHPFLNAASAGAGATGWYLRNEWHRLTYYAAAEESTPDGLPFHGCDATDCLLFNNVRNIRALLVLAGRSLDGTARPNGSFADFVEYDNGDFGTGFEGVGVGYMQRWMRLSKAPMAAIGAPFNDRVVLVDWRTSLSESAQVVDNTAALQLRLLRWQP